nr:hypothetical protein [Tanacetum cinerariifolium]
MCYYHTFAYVAILATGYTGKKDLFYCLPGSDLSDGIGESKFEQQLADFVAAALGNGGHIDVYVEQHGYDIHDWFAKDNDDLEDYDEDEYEKEDQSVDLICKVKPGIVYPDHDPDQPWKDMVPILGMKFKDHEEMKMILANYGVANGYQLWYKMNDYKSLLVVYGRIVKEGRCARKVGRKGTQENVSKASKSKEKVAEGKGKEKVAEGKGKEKVTEGSKIAMGNKKWTKQAIKLWGSWMQSEASFQIKTLIPYHNCARVFDFEALVTYKWIARNYVREIVSNPKISHKELQAAIREKFLINVSLGHRSVIKNNPGSTVKLDVDEVSGGKTYFIRFYVCFKAMKDGWTEGCKK